ncbi:MAG: S26 family signal peptidase [Thermoguttaceae bacterium]
MTVAVLVGQTWCLEGVLDPFEVSSGSMAETLLGPHWDVVCDDCGLRFAHGADLPRSGQTAICPNCGYRTHRLPPEEEISGDRLLVHKSIWRLRSPRRWEVAAFRRSDGTGRIYVKRIVGLPGESVQIRDGDVYIDGEIQRKTLAEQKRLAVLVHDADYSPRLSKDVPPSWRGESDRTHWNSTGGVFAHPEITDERQADWLIYHHWVRLSGQGNDVRETPITNDSSYNQVESHNTEPLFRTNDLLLSFHASKFLGKGRLLIRATAGDDVFLTEIDLETGDWRVSRNNQQVAASRGLDHVRAAPRELQVDISLFDRQFLFALGGQVLATFTVDGGCCNIPANCTPFALGIQDAGVEIRHLRIYRDVYYTRPLGLIEWGISSPVHLGRDEYFLLGDDSSISEDSRTWPEGPAVLQSQFLGKPLLVHFPARRVGLGGWHFQVPDLAKIRYIH